MDKRQLIALLGDNMYANSLSEVLKKELVQNSFDAIKIEKSLHQDLKGLIHVETDTIHRTITVTDNGIGMTPEIIQDAFLTIGGSFKGEDIEESLKSGGLGFAKMVFLFGPDWIEISSTHDGQTTHIRATREELLDDNFIIETTYTGAPNGTKVIVRVPEVYQDKNGDKRSISLSRYSQFLDRPLIGDIYLQKDGGCPEYKGNIPSEYLYLGKAKAVFGDIQLWIAPTGYSSIRREVLISGLFQFQDNIWPNANQEVGLKVLMNILPSVGVRDRVYPINNQREGFRATISAEVNDLEQLLLKVHSAFAKGQYAAAFDSCISMDVDKLSTPQRIPYEGDILKEAVREVQETFTPAADISEDWSISMEVIHSTLEKERESSLDTSEVNLPNTKVRVDTSMLSFEQPVFHNNTTMVIEEDGKSVLDQFGALLLMLKSMYSEAYKGFVRKQRWSEDVDISKRLETQYWGISFDTGYQGVNVSPELFNFIGVNPFGFRVPTYPGVDPVWFLTEYITHVIIHEVNHNYVRGEGESFTGELVITEAEFASLGEAFSTWKGLLHSLIEENLEVFLNYNQRFLNSSNRSTSLKQ